MNAAELGVLQQGLTYAQYDAIPGLRAGELKHLKRSPAHFLAAKTNPKEPTDALEFGSLFHSAIENGEKFMDTYVVEPEFVGKTKDGRDSNRSAEAKQMKIDWYAAQPKSAVIVKAKWVEPLTGMLQSVLKHPISKLLAKGIKETSLWVQDPRTGLTLKCRPDFIAEAGFIVDIKTARDARPPAFYKQIYGTRNVNDPYYVLQAAHYTHCLRLAKYGRGDNFTFVAIEKDPPYGIMTYALDINALAPGEQWRAELTDLYKKCMDEDKWPCYPTAAVSVIPDEWVELPGDDDEDDQVGHGG